MRSTKDIRWSELLRKANGGDRKAYVVFLKEIAPVLRGVIVARSGGQNSECEDILQNVLIAIHEKRHTWRDTEPATAWVYAIARYKTVDALRKTGRSRLVAFDGAETEYPDDTVHDPTVVGDLERLLDQLDTTSATIVRQIKLHGSTAEEVGDQVGMTPGAIRVALHRALGRLTALVTHDRQQSTQNKTQNKKKARK
ncbi:sigma factor [Loktanella sp. SALINAS62]|uniref:sigma factor n=1 Tax=Loktanella sp. SALINAS62 TaxID=2706124 RepID=UPI001B8AD0EE|nr:sigma factor [Loktanella sp. SALINAS62]MBS1302930.1 RNA polymerase subunit sigma-70 [Loktanella sp. SALINAS62]